MNFDFIVLASRGENIEVQMADVEVSIVKICHKRRKVCARCAASFAHFGIGVGLLCDLVFLKAALLISGV